MWNKSLWVFDQTKDAWFTWDGEEWLSGVPVIEALHFSGTGARFLRRNVKQAIESLFERSFTHVRGPRPNTRCIWLDCAHGGPHQRRHERHHFVV